MSTRLHPRKAAPLRRGLVAILVAWATWFAAVAIVPATASEGLGPIPETFALPEPRIGDRVAYAVGNASGPHAENAEGDLRPVMRFEWGEPATVLNRDGNLESANALMFERRALREGQWEIRAGIDYFSASSKQMIASVLEHEEPASDFSPEVSSVYVTYATEPGPRTRWHPAAVVVPIDGPCGLFNPFQGKAVPLTDTFVLFTSCYVGFLGSSGAFPSWTAGQYSFEAVHTEQTSAGPAVLFRGTSGVSARDPFLVWFAPHIPYPVKMAMPRHNEPDAFVVTVLTGFDPGSRPLVGPQEPSMGPVPPVRFGTAAPWTIDDADVVDHPLRLSDAFQWALKNDPDNRLSTFVNAHPNSYVGLARFRHWQRGDQDARWTWDFVVTDGAARLNLAVTRLDARPLPYNPLLRFPDDVNQHESEYSFSTSLMGVHDSVFPTRDRLPKHLPSASWLLEAAAEFSGAHGHPGAGNSWGFDFACSGDCSTVRPTFWAGRDASREIPSYWSNAIEGRDVVDAREVWFDHTLRPLALAASTGQRDASPDAGGPSEAAQDPGPPMAASLDLAGIARPSSVATFAAAALAGALYWTWPVFKSWAWVPLFSRIEAPKALRQRTRAELYDLILAEPGIHLQELVRRTGRGATPVTHHLRKLVQTGLIESRTGQGYVCYFPKGQIDRRLQATAPVLKSRGAQEVLRSLLLMDATSAAEVAERAGLRRQTVEYHLERLASAGLVVRGDRIAATDLARAASS